MGDASVWKGFSCENLSYRRRGYIGSLTQWEQHRLTLTPNPHKYGKEYGSLIIKQMGLLGENMEKVKLLRKVEEVTCWAKKEGHTAHSLGNNLLSVWFVICGMIKCSWLKYFNKDTRLKKSAWVQRKMFYKSFSSLHFSFDSVCMHLNTSDLHCIKHR